MMLDMESVLTAVDITWTNETGHRCQIQETEIQKKVAGAFTTRQASSAQSRQIQVGLPHACMDRAEIRCLKDQQMTNVRVRVPESKAEQ